MGFWLGSLEQGLIFAIMVLGVYISYKILDFPDLSVDGSFPLGAAIVGAGLLKGINPIICLILATIGGALAGLFTGIIHVRFKIRDLLSGILVMTALYSINLRVMGKSNIHLFNVKHLFSSRVDFILVKIEDFIINLPLGFEWILNKIGISKISFKLFLEDVTKKYADGTISIFIILLILLIVKLLLDFLLKTQFGFALRALGDNEKLVIALGINEKRLKIIGLMLANALVALAGGVLAQHQGFSDIGMGTGIIVAGLASIILGEGIFKNVKFIKMTTVVLIGSIIYRFAIALALKMGLRATDLKLVTALIVIAILAPKLNILTNLKAKAGENDAEN